jgi:uncharacterized repeat protein (TIGR01451 family)
MTTHRCHWGRWLLAAGLGGAAVPICGPSALAAPQSSPSPTTMTMSVSDDPHHVVLGEVITYTIVASNNGDTDSTDFLVAVSWEPEATFVSFTAPPGWTVNLPPIVLPNALSTFSDSLLADSSVTFTLVLIPSEPGQFTMAASLFSSLPHQTQSTEIERTPVTTHGH